MLSLVGRDAVEPERTLRLTWDPVFDTRRDPNVTSNRFCQRTLAAQPLSRDQIMGDQSISIAED